MVFTLGVPAAPSSSSRALAPYGADVIGVLENGHPVGREALLRLGGVNQEASAGKKAGMGFPDEKIVIPVGITPQTLKNFTLYDVLGFGGEIGGAADVDAIKRAYHKAVLMYHPDKAQFKTEDGKEDRTVFLKIQEAMTVLSNETKRRAYDSQLPFDESIPNEERIAKMMAKGPHKFFKLFGPVFLRNARFAVKKPVPDIGDMDTPMIDVYKFYDYWVKFESWRDFTGIGAEHKPDDATSRAEKRYMMQENEKVAKKLKKKEMERIINLVTTAQAIDPRVVADQEARRLAKESEKAAKEANANAKAELEAAAQEWDAKMEADALAAKGETKAEREKVKKALSKSRNTLRKQLRFSASGGHGDLGEYGIISDADMEILCTNCGQEDLDDMVGALGGDAAGKDQAALLTTGFPVVYEKVEFAKGANERLVEDENIAKEVKKMEPQFKAAMDRKKKNAVDDEKEWAEDELALLKRAFERYRAGTIDRWQVIVNFLNYHKKPAESYKKDECLRAAYKLKHA